MRLCSYVITHDTGLAPNPYWGYCTLALCTPNHMGIKLVQGDWIIATSSKATGRKLVCAMQVSEILSFNDYYADPRFEDKKPVRGAPGPKRCGDNVYYKDEQGKWVQHPSDFHRGPELNQKDTKHPYVYVAEHFYYFGAQAVPIPADYQDLIWTKQGCKCAHDSVLVAEFLEWLQAAYSPGVLGKPRDAATCSGERC